MSEKSTPRPSYIEWVQRHAGELMFTTAVAFSLFVQWQARRHFIPGNWPGEQGWSPDSLGWGALLTIVFCAAAIQLSSTKRYWLLAVMAAVVIGPIFIKWPVGDWEYRYGAERSSYQRAAQRGSSFGDQHSEEVDGRTLTYWRWMSWGLDNGIGILYDPEDRLDKDSRDDLYAFNRVNGGVLWTVVQIEPCWYYVTHT